MGTGAGADGGARLRGFELKGAGGAFAFAHFAIGAVAGVGFLPVAPAAAAGAVAA